MRTLSICSGIGGLELGLRLATGGRARVVCYVEGEAFAASVLAARAQEGLICDAPIFSDVKRFDPEPWRGKVDCITAGYPCQPFSHAGRRKGAEDPRHLWPHIAAHVRVLRPRYVFCENVPGHVTLGFEQVCEDLCGMGYSIEAGVFSAAEVGAPHLRKRLFFIAHATGDDTPRIRRTSEGRGRQIPDFVRNGSTGKMANDAHADGGAVRPQFRGQQRPGRNAPVQPWVDGEQGHVANANQCRWHGGMRANKLSARRIATPGSGQNNSRTTRSAQTTVTGQAESNGSFKVVANANGNRQRGGRASQPQAQVATAARESGSIDAGSRGALGRLGELAPGPAALVDHLAQGWPGDWEDGVPRVTTGQPHRIDRLRALGNAVVPQTAALAWTTLMQQAIDRDR